MRIKKLSLAAAISIGIMTVGIPASLAVDNVCPETCPTPTGGAAATTADQASAAIPQTTTTAPAGSRYNIPPSSYGAGVAGTFRTTGTLKPYGGNVAGSTEIATFNSPINVPVNSALAQQGIYGQCPPCQVGTPGTIAPGGTAVGGAAGLSVPPGASVVTIQKQEQTPGLTGGAAPVATPQASELPGGAAAAERQDMRCTSPPVRIPVVAPVTTGGAACVQPCVPSTSACPTGRTNANAPRGFEQPVNPGAICPESGTAPTTGAAATVEPSVGLQGGEPLSVETPQQRYSQETGVAIPTGGAGPITTPVTPANPMIQQPCPAAPAAPCPVTPVSPCPVAPQAMAPCPTAIITCPSGCPMNIQQTAPTGTAALINMPKGGAAAIIQSNAATTTPWQITGAAAPLSAPAMATCKSAANTQYLERQVYAYPSMPGGRTTVIPTGSNAIALGSGGGVASINPVNQAIASNATNIISGSQTFTVTGAAAPVSGTSVIPGCGQQIQQTISSGTPVTRILQTAEATPIVIQTQSGLTIQRCAFVPMALTTGAAAPVSNMFADIPSNFWANNAINRLASAGIISGYPDRTFKPNLPVSRAEFASMLVSGLNLQNTQAFNQQVFNDVPNRHWANNPIDKAYNRGLVAGYPDNTFRPNNPVSRAEALTTLSKAIPAGQAQLTAVEADQILSQYQDADQVPTWARIQVAQSLKSGILQGSPTPNVINPNQNATRADVASMLSNLRQSLALEAPEQMAAGSITGAAAAIQQQTMTVPTLNVKFIDEVSARTSHVGDKFSAETLEPVTINNVVYPAGSKVNGRIVEVIRPGNGQDGALKLSFTDIESSGQRAALPRDVLMAQVQETGGKNILQRLVEFPFVWPGRLIGITGRTVAGMTAIVGNSGEQVLSNSGAALGQVVRGQFGAAGRTGIDAGRELITMPFETVRTAFNGATGLFNVTTDEISYLAGQDGNRIARVIPNDRVTIAFGCLE